jgi:predicted nucleic acid-binding protein
MSILEEIEGSRVEALISAQVLSEVSGVLYRQYGMKDTTKHVAGMLSYRLRVHPVTAEMVRAAAEYSRDFGILPYDGIHIATAVNFGAAEIISADRELDKAKKVILRKDPLDYSKSKKP